MPHGKGLWCLVAAASVGTSVSVVSAQTQCNRQVGPDVIVGELSRGNNDISAGIGVNFTAFGGYDAFSVGTFSCNVGNVNINWLTFGNTGNPNENRHPVIGQNLFKLKQNTVGSGTYYTFEHLGQSWLKHGFTALTQNTCCTCNGQGGTVLGVGCADPYTAGRNATQSSLGPKWQVNAHTGVFAYPPANPTYNTGDSTARRLAVPLSELDTTSTYYIEGQYVTQDDATAGNQNNNASYRQVSMAGGPTDFSFSLVGSTQRERQGIKAWKTADPSGITETTFQIPGDGLCIIDSKATSLGGGIWHYEYAVYNMNADRNIGSIRIPLPGSAVVTNIGFHCPQYRNGDGNGNVNFSSTPWTTTRTAYSITFATETQAANNNANAIRWGTLFNFRFDADVAPAASGTLNIDTWKVAGSYAITAQVPTGAPCYPNCDGSAVEPVLNVLDFNCFLSRFSAGDSYANCDGSTEVPVLNVLDFNCFLSAFATGCR
jgi:hypothetical protein